MKTKEEFFMLPIFIESDIQEEVKISEYISIFPFSKVLKMNMRKDYERKDILSKVFEDGYRILNVDDLLVTYDPRKSDFYYSNYFIKISKRNLSLNCNASFLLNIALLLFKFKYGVSEHCSITQDDVVYEKKGGTQLNLSDIENFKHLYLSLVNISDQELNLVDKKFRIMSYKFLNATQEFPSRLNFGLYFIDLMTILEMLYTSEGENNELSFRVSLLIAKIFEKNNIKIDEKNENETTKKRFDEVRNLYKIRSSLVHSGESKHLNEEKFKKLAEIVRKSLLLYLDDPKQFEQDSLLSLICSCLGDKREAGQIVTSSFHSSSQCHAKLIAKDEG